MAADLIVASTLSTLVTAALIRFSGGVGSLRFFVYALAIYFIGRINSVLEIIKICYLCCHAYFVFAYYVYVKTVKTRKDNLAKQVT